MKTNFLFLILALAIGIPYGAAQQLTLDTTVSSDGVRTLGHATSKEMKSAPIAMAGDSSQTTITEWMPCEGSWVYVSNYTKQTYPTKVQRRIWTYESDGVTYRETQLAFTNSLFGMAYLDFFPETSRISIYNSEGAGRVNLLDAEGQPTDKYVYTNAMPDNRALANVMQYPASEAYEILLYLVEKDESTGEYDYNNIEYITYDYLYNADAQPAKIDVEIPRLVKSPFTIEGKCGSGVTDLYFVQALSKRDEQRAEENPDLAQYGLPVNYQSMPVILSDYISTGKLNPAVKIEKIAMNESGEFSVAVNDQWEGMRGVSLIALKDGEICDQKYVAVEMCNNTGWKTYKNLDFTFTIPAALTEDNQVKVIDKKAKMEINEAAKLMRICQPYGNFASDFNYIYLDYSLGMDKCFVTDSYTPNTYSYTYYKQDMTESAQVTLPYHFESMVSANLRNGISLDTLLDVSSGLGWFFDLSSEVAAGVTTIFQDENRSLFGGIYVVDSSQMAIAMSDVAGINFDNYYFMNISMGMDVAKVEFSFINSDKPTVSSQTYSIENNGEIYYYFDIIQELIANRISKTADVVKFTFFNKSGAVVRSGEIAIPYDMAADFAELSYDPYIIANYPGYRRCTYETSQSGNPLIKLYDFFNSGYYTGVEYGSENILEIEIEDGSPKINDLYFGKLSFTNFGDCDVYANFSDISLTDNIISSTMYMYVYNNGDLIGYWEMSNATITLPRHYVDTSAIEDVEIDVEGVSEMPVEYFNLQGQRVTYPAKGSLYIERKGGNARKVQY